MALRKSAKQWKGSEILSSCCNQCMQANNGKRSVAERWTMATHTVHNWETASTYTNLYARGTQTHCGSGKHCVKEKRKSTSEGKKLKHRERHTKPQSLQRFLRVLLQWFNFSQNVTALVNSRKLGSFLRATFLEEACLSNKQLTSSKAIIFPPNGLLQVHGNRRYKSCRPLCVWYDTYTQRGLYNYYYKRLHLPLESRLNL